MTNIVMHLETYTLDRHIMIKWFIFNEYIL